MGMENICDLALSEKKKRDQNVGPQTTLVLLDVTIIVDLQGGACRWAFTGPDAKNCWL